MAEGRRRGGGAEGEREGGKADWEEEASCLVPTANLRRVSTQSSGVAGREGEREGDTGRDGSGRDEREEGRKELKEGGTKGRKGEERKRG